ncbi:MAG: ATP-binding cassette domain-containing protein, partial [Bacilli bacterium]|nr:ATP-binding cassette domain-containing protein [Bacilli bacterium]
MLKCEEIEKVYKTKKGEPRIEALSGLSLMFPETGMVFVLGKSGCGKSTLLNIIGGLDKPSSGRILVDGRDISTFKEKELDYYRNTYVGFVFQDFALVDEFNVSQNIAFALELQGIKPNKGDIAKVLKLVGLEKLEYRRISSL